MLTGTKNILNLVVPISRFNKGEANRIFEEVNATGPKIVLKNNKPTCVLVPPEEYERMLERLEDYELLTEAQKRMENEPENTFSQEEIMKRFGITQEDLIDAEDDVL